MIIIFNGVCNYGLVIAELLARFQIPCKLYTIDRISKELLNFFPYFEEKNIIINNKISLAQDLKNAKLCINVSMGLIEHLGIKRFIFYVLLKKIPVVNIPTGSDLSEIEIEGWLRRFLFLILLRNGTTHLPHYFYSIRIFLKYKFKNLFLSRHPYLLQKKQERINDEEIIFFHASNLDWGAIDNKRGRNSIKNNLIFIKAFIKASKYLSQCHIAVKCLILDRGPDKELAKEIIHLKKADSFFEWIPPTTTVQLAKYISRASIVVDQFYLGILGMIAMESMAQAKAVMIYIDKNYWSLVYSEEPPIINCHTEDEIYEAILKWADHKKLRELGERAEKWVRKYHDVHTADFSEFILRVCLMAGLEWPRKDLAKENS